MPVSQAIALNGASQGYLAISLILQLRELHRNILLDR